MRRHATFILPHALSSICFAFLAAAAWPQTVPQPSSQSLTVIDLRHRTAEELIPILQPLAGRGALSGQNYKLLVRADAVDVARIREALAVLDRAPRGLRVSVRFTDANDARSVQGTADARDQTAVGAATLSTAVDGAISSVRLLEGGSARIATGSSVPIVSAAFASRRNRTSAAALEYRDATTGFSVTPVLNGENVRLDVRAHRQQPNASFESQSVSTTIVAPLGEWVEVGRTANEESSSGISGSARASGRLSTRSHARAVMVKVEVEE